METFKRTDRVSSLLRHEIASILREEVKDPRLNMLSVTMVKVAPDLKHAKVYISPFREEDVETIFECIKKARGFIQKSLGKRVKLRYTPVIEFFIDDSIKYSAHIMDVIEGLKREKQEDGE